MTFSDFLRSLGLKPGTVLPDGKWRRCPTDDHPRRRNGSYKLAIDGRFGVAQNWAIHDSAQLWTPEGREAEPLDLRALREAQQEARGERQRSAEAAQLFYAGCKPLRGGHPYLESKKLGVECEGLKVDGSGWLVVPAWKSGQIVSVQRIAPDGKKLFWKGAPVRGSSYEIRRRGAPVTVLVEGLATGMACFRALRTCRVIVCWDAGNMARTPVRPTGLVVIAADNDQGTEARLGRNPGIEAAQAVAKVLGCGVAFPEGIEGTDWADWRIERLEAGKAERDVDGELAGILQRHAVYVRPSMKGTWKPQHISSSV